MKNQKNIRLLLIIGILIVINFIASGFFRRIDLTKEKRYSLSAVSQQTADSLKVHPMFIQIYMDGDYPPNIRRFQDAVSTTLGELQQYAHGNLNFEFVNPANNKELMTDLAKKGFPGIRVTLQNSDIESQQSLLFPYALVRYREQEPQYIDLVKGCVLPNGQIDFLKAEADLEYKLVAPMRTMLKEQKGVVAVLQGHGELGIEDIGEWVTALQNSYEVYSLNQRKNPGQSLAPSITPEKMKAIGKEVPDNLKYKRGIDVIIIAQPQIPFTEREKYELDQYLMRGGSILWLMNQQVVDMDMFEKRSTLTQLRELNLDDMFMKYGCKINYNLIQDLMCEKTEVFQEGSSGGTFTSAPWIFYPMAFTFPSHPISRNLDNVLMRYASTVDTFAQPEVKKKVFLTSSENSRTIDGQQFIDLNKYLSEKPPVGLFRNKGGKIVGVSMEGNFVSLFANRQAPTDSLAPTPPTAAFGAKSGLPGKMVVLADGQFAIGKLFRGKRGYIPYDNKTLLLNAVDFLAGDETLTKIRAKNVEARLLDKNKIAAHKNGVRFVNLLLPILLIIAFGFVRAYLRKKKYEKV